MKASYECLNCVAKNGLNLINKVKKINDYTEEELFNAYKDILKSVVDNSFYGLKPIEISLNMYDKFYELFGKRDYYENEKTNSNQIFLEMYDDLLEFCRNSKNPIKLATKLSAVGNLIDYGIKNSFGELEWEIENLTKNREFSINDFDILDEKLKNANSLLFIHDNAGEIVLDKILIKVIKDKYPDLMIHSAVRSTPIINDATLKDTEEINLKEVSIPIESGSIYPGTILSNVNTAFKNIFDNSDVIISKGQGNFEGLEFENGNIFYILMAKCKTIADVLGVNVGEIVLKNL
ncbi:ARMT1-like domain-containing protein [Oceanotoga sp. DSM 15011]|jgi:hypothetical protein|uniref:Damage-control phosphatase ARMT1-like metal-binding domain-containing protein n=1 Tax=Oceanotoga teriensis TaxID=515440 RepID=A0AA45HJA4_9BACT|nr:MULTISPECIES: ARMT1-like domain-containing protein [Oceanotoga]MDN5341197.1 damage-control phosphatase, subfamily [Oceanotoga sp.]MDO7976878.1 ARMT1-like domain-containing protein [Oceanotoga teriensis]PWJ95958.1 hypothetical protein C7380_103137 [Oceanotoga teriensis]UYP00819.1 ARMT1-like domain-containing protein [Oceanotoga sp. DSM 15011]